MSPLLITFLGVLLVPLFVTSWRTSLLGLSCQGLIMASIAYNLDPDPGSPEVRLALVDLFLVRGIVAPFILYRVLRAQQAPPRHDLIPPNLLSWTAALGLVLVAFQFASAMVPAGGDEQTLVAVAATGVLLAMLVLATQNGPFSQMDGALRLENAVAMLELGGGTAHQALGLRAAQLLLLIGTVFLFRGYLQKLPASPAPPPPPEGDGA